MMGKNMVTGEDADEIYECDTLLSLEDDFIEFMYNKLKKVKKNYPLLYRLVYSSFAHYEFFPEDLPRLNAEITDLLNDSTIQTSVREVLKKLSNITKKAISENKSLFAK